jgi:hypothetical protein
MGAQTATPSNVRSSGLLITANSENGFAIFSGYDLGPGDVRSARIMIANSGAVRGKFRLSEADASSDFAAGQLRLVIDDITDKHPNTVFVGEIGGLPEGGINLGYFEPSELRRFRFIVTLDPDSPGGNLDRAAGAAYEWDLVPTTPIRD